jgi:hypothetical protein
MANAQIIDVAEAVCAGLNAGTFSLPFTAVRSYTPVSDLENSKALVVTVVPKSDDGTLDSRSSSVHKVAIDIGIQKKLPNLTNESIDPLMRLVQEIADYFLFGQNPAGASLMTPQVRILYVPDQLQTLMQFTSVCELTFTASRFED